MKNNIINIIKCAYRYYLHSLRINKYWNVPCGKFQYISFIQISNIIMLLIFLPILIIGCLCIKNGIRIPIEVFIIIFVLLNLMHFLPYLQLTKRRLHKQYPKNADAIFKVIISISIVSFFCLIISFLLPFKLPYTDTFDMLFLSIPFLIFGYVTSILILNPDPKYK